jgi:putative ABC transport system ATP-binding protein
MIRAVDLKKSYRMGEVEQVVLRGVNLQVKPGEFVAIMGKSGAGKSTLLYQLGLLDHPTSGQVFLDGVDTTKLSSNARTQFLVRSVMTWAQYRKKAFLLRRKIGSKHKRRNKE